MPYKDPEKRKAAAKINSQRHYERNKELLKRRARAWSDAQTERLRALVWEYLALHPCIDCGEADPVVLEFDHREPEAKYKGVSLLIQHGVSVATLFKEIEKCDVRCANCHRRKTAKQFGWHNAFRV